MGSGSTLATDLSDRGLKALVLFVQGLVTAEITEWFYLTRNKVLSYVSAILTTLDADDRMYTTILAVRHELVVAGDWN